MDYLLQLGACFLIKLMLELLLGCSLMKKCMRTGWHRNSIHTICSHKVDWLPASLSRSLLPAPSIPLSASSRDSLWVASYQAHLRKAGKTLVRWETSDLLPCWQLVWPMDMVLSWLTSKSGACMCLCPHPSHHPLPSPSLSLFKASCPYFTNEQKRLLGLIGVPLWSWQSRHSKHALMPGSC